MSKPKPAHDRGWSGFDDRFIPSDRLIALVAIFKFYLRLAVMVFRVIYVCVCVCRAALCCCHPECFSLISCTGTAPSEPALVTPTTRYHTKTRKNPSPSLRPASLGSHYLRVWLGGAASFFFFVVFRLFFFRSVFVRFGWLVGGAFRLAGRPPRRRPRPVPLGEPLLGRPAAPPGLRLRLWSFSRRRRRAGRRGRRRREAAAGAGRPGVAAVTRRWRADRPAPHVHGAVRRGFRRRTGRQGNRIRSSGNQNHIFHRFFKNSVLVTRVSHGSLTTWIVLFSIKLYVYNSDIIAGPMWSFGWLQKSRVATIFSVIVCGIWKWKVPACIWHLVAIR